MGLSREVCQGILRRREEVARIKAEKELEALRRQTVAGGSGGTINRAVKEDSGTADRSGKEGGAQQRATGYGGTANRAEKEDGGAQQRATGYGGSVSR